jgi:hypothetical protein
MKSTRNERGGKIMEEQPSEIVKGVTVEVVKGKNFTIGTTGIVFWVATKPDNFNNFRVGFITANGKKVFINIELLAVKKGEK